MSAVRDPAPGWQAPLIGRPWRLHARGPDAFDCWGLVEWAWAEFAGLDLSPFRRGAVARDSRTRALEMAARAEAAAGSDRFMGLARPRPLAIGVVTFKRIPVHVGLYARGGRFVHACEDSGAVRQDEVADFATRSGSKVTAWYWPADAATGTGGAAWGPGGAP